MKPKNIDLVVGPSILTEETKNIITQAIAQYKKTGQKPDTLKRPLNKSEQVIYNRLKKSAGEIKLYKEGKIAFQDANEFLQELQGVHE